MPSTIRLTSVSSPRSIACPNCGEAFVTVESHALRTIGGRDWVEDRLELPVADIMFDEQQGMPYFVTVGGDESPCCGKPYLVVQAAFARRLVGEEPHFLELFFRDLGERGTPAYFIASLGSLNWLVARFTTNYGPILEHSFGPFADAPMPFVRDLLSGTRNELTALQSDVYAAFMKGEAVRRA
jgi:hypothetical protein